MSGEHKLCAKNFANDLIKSVDTANATINANLNPKIIEKINFIVDTYVVTPPLSLEPIDIVRFSVEDIVELLSLIGTNPKFIEDVKFSFEKQCYIFNTTSNKVKKEDATKFLNSILEEIKQYINKYDNINSSQVETITNRINLYTQIANSILNDINDYIDNIDEIVKVLTTNAIPENEQWQILAFIGEKNLELYKKNNKDINNDLDVKYQANRLRDEYLSFNEYLENIKKIVSAYLSKNPIDFDLIPTIALNIAQENNMLEDKVKIQNILVAILVNVLYSEYLYHMDDENFKLETKEIINNILEFERNKGVVHNPVWEDVIKKAYTILKSNIVIYDDIMHLTEQEILSAPEDTLDDLMKKGMNQEEALRSKKNALLRLIDNKLSSIDMDDEEQTNLIISELVDLIDIYDYYVYQENSIKKL